jgi:transcriptional regulator with XRE-family HTH domain
MERAATIKDIARKLNVSISTVSRALRNAHDVSADTRAVHQDKDMSDVDEVLKTKLFIRESSQRLIPKNNRFK